MSNDRDLVIVAGAGAAGCAAAISIAQSGRNVLLADANERFREASNTAMSTSMIPAGGSQWQSAQGIEDSPALFREDIRRKTKGQADPTVTHVLTEVAPELVAWLYDDVGVPLDLVTDFVYPGHSTARCHAVEDRSGATLHRHLLAAVRRHEQEGRVTTAVPMRLSDVELDRASVTSVVLSTPDGSREEVAASDVVLCTNGFGAADDLVRTHIPEIAAGVYHGGDYSLGDALRIGRRLHAATACLDAYQGHGSLIYPDHILLTWAFVVHGGVLVNRNGHRFGDESVGYSEFGAKVGAQPEGVAWALYDDRIHRRLARFADYQKALEADAVRWFDNLESVAEFIGCPASELTTTLEQARPGSCPFGRSDWREPLSAPFAAVRVTGALFHTQGGLQVDSAARVLQEDGTPIGGLYATGGAAVGMSGHGAGGYLAGNGLLAALGLGLVAGRAIAGPAASMRG